MENKEYTDSIRVVNSARYIDVREFIKMSKQEKDSIGYSIEECNLLLADTLLGHITIDLNNAYKSIEELIDIYNINYIGGCNINISEIKIPILKHHNKALIVGYKKTSDYSGFGYSYILSLIKPNKLRIEGVYTLYDDYVQPEPQLTKEDSLYQDNQDKGSNKLMEFIKRNTNYPISAQNDSIKGSVTISYGIREDLSVSDYKIEKSNFNKKINKKVRDDFENEALRVVKLINFKDPAFHYGDLVRRLYSTSETYQYGEQIRMAVIVIFEK